MLPVNDGSLLHLLNDPVIFRRTVYCHLKQQTFVVILAVIFCSY